MGCESSSPPPPGLIIHSGHRLIRGRLPSSPPPPWLQHAGGQQPDLVLQHHSGHKGRGEAALPRAMEAEGGGREDESKEGGVVGEREAGDRERQIK